MITFYSKKDCKPCDYIFDQFKKKFKDTEYTKVVLQTNEEAIQAVEKYKVKTVPFIVLNETIIIPNESLRKLIRAIN